MVSPKGMQQKADKWASRFVNWLEHVDGREKLVMEMSKSDFSTAAATRLERGQHEIAIHTLWRRLHDMVPDGKVLSDVMTAVEVDEIYETIKTSIEGNEV